MRGRLVWQLGVVLSVLAIVSGFANAQHGSFTAQLDILNLDLTVLVEQQIAEVGGWLVYAGTGFGVAPWRVTRFDPYTLACREVGVLSTYSELCVEARVDFASDDGFALQTFWTTTW